MSSFAGFDQAMITVGGIKTNQIQPQTMESKKIKGLKFVGEVLDWMRKQEDTIYRLHGQQDMLREAQ